MKERNEQFGLSRNFEVHKIDRRTVGCMTRAWAAESSAWHGSNVEA